MTTLEDFGLVYPAWDDPDALLEQVEREIAREELDRLFDLAEKYGYRLVYDRE